MYNFTSHNHVYVLSCKHASRPISARVLLSYLKLKYIYIYIYIYIYRHIHIYIFFSSLTGDVELNPGPVTAESMTNGKEMSFVEADFVLTQNAQA